LSDKLGLPADVYTQAADRAEESFHEKFWRANLGYYLDIVEPDDSSLRPNQLIAMSLAFGPMRKEQAAIALEIVGRELLTPVGMRTLGPHIPGYKPQFRGPIVELDAAYHQGTVWPWLMGPYVGALLRVTGDTTEARRILRNCRNMMTEFGIGGLAEVYDGDEPRHPAGCPWQAWSVAEWLRAATLLQKTKA
jgi:glycogen debranching enzyme